MAKQTPLPPTSRFPFPNLAPLALGDSSPSPHGTTLSWVHLLSWLGLIWGSWSIAVIITWHVVGVFSWPVTLGAGFVLTLLLAAWSGRRLRALGRPLEIRPCVDKTPAPPMDLQLQQAQKLEAVGRLAGGVAHDFNNLLTVIQGYGSLLLDMLRTQPQAADMVRDIMKAGDKATALTRQLLFFSRKQVPVPRRVDVNALVANLQKMLRRLIGEDINFKVRLAAGVLPVKIDPGQFEQVVMNLVVNARDAMPTGGALTLQTELSNDGFISLTVTDTGMGMDEEVKARLFEPFFTTKQPGKGTGLGLATVHGIVQHYGGTIQVQSQPGKGAEFRIVLPVTDEPAVPQEMTQSPTPPRNGTETILLVEDESGVRDMARIVLQGQGYRVLEARHGQEALTLCQQSQSKIDLVVTDVVMPVMGGVELMEQLAPRFPDLKALYMSGYNESAVVRHGLQEDLLVCLQKPFTPDELAEAVGELLETGELQHA